MCSLVWWYFHSSCAILFFFQVLPHSLLWIFQNIQVQQNYFLSPTPYTELPTTPSSTLDWGLGMRAAQCWIVLFYWLLPILERWLCVGINEGSVRVDLRDGMKYLGWSQLPFLVPSFFNCPRGFFPFPILFYPRSWTEKFSNGKVSSWKSANLEECTFSGSKSVWSPEFMLILLIDIPGRNVVLYIDWYEMSIYTH